MSETHTVKQGEYLPSIALAHGFSDWHTIYDHPHNAQLWKKRASPDILLPGDKVFIPDRQQKQESCNTEQRHEFQVRLPTITLKIALKDVDGKAMAYQPYTLKFPGRVYSGNTDGYGLLQQEISIGFEEGELHLPSAGKTWKLKIGHLDPVHNEGEDKPIISGVQARLNNLGYRCGPVDGILGPQTTKALKLFQQDVLGRENPTGEPDQETRDALCQQHGS